MLGWCFLVIYMSCHAASSSEQTYDSGDIQVRMVSHITYGTDPEAEKWYEYTDNGDIYRYNAFIDTVVFTYTNDKIFKRYYNKSNQWLTEIVYDIDSTGRVIASRIFAEDHEEISRYRLEYNQDGYLTRTVQDLLSTGKQYVNDFIYSDGNLTEIITYTYDGKPATRYVYEYDQDKPNMLNIFMHSLLDDFMMNDRLGKQNKNLVSRMANISMEGDTLSLVHITYPKSGDSNKLIENMHDVLNEIEVEKTYHLKPLKN
jgi:hypothetical protein